MQLSDLDGISRSGALARQRGDSLDSNPHYLSKSPDLLECHVIATAWSVGWLDEDAGRDKEFAALMLLRAW